MLVKRSSLGRSRAGEAGSETVERLKDRRRRLRRRASILLAIFLVALLSGFLWLSWQPYARISEVTITPENPQLLALVKAKLAGSYLGLAPRDSSFFVSERALRSALLAADTSIRAVSIERELTGLSITLHERVSVAAWCATECFLFDADGLLYAPAATGTSPLNGFTIHDALTGGAVEPLGATLSHAKAMPNLFDFARKIGTLGSVVKTVTITGDEADLLLASGTRLIYVLGSEEAAYTNLVSAGEELDFTSGALEYIDLRFPAKVYLKRRGDTVVE